MERSVCVYACVAPPPHTTEYFVSVYEVAKRERASLIGFIFIKRRSRSVERKLDAADSRLPLSK